jgi:hypothetical protein
MLSDIYISSTKQMCLLEDNTRYSDQCEVCEITSVVEQRPRSVTFASTAQWH